MLYSPGCTAKAITHRVAKFREAASKLDSQDGADVPATPPTVKKRGRKAKASDAQAGDDGADPTPTKKPRTSKVKKSAVAAKEEDVSGEEEKIKDEPADEEETEAVA